MSIDKESDGVPEVNVQRRTTKVNLWMIAAILAFFVVAAAAAIFISRRSESSSRDQPKAADGATGRQP